MNNTVFFAFLFVLILGVFYVLKTSDNPPDTGMTQTPKEYIEYVERAKAAKRATEKQDQAEMEALNRQ